MALHYILVCLLATATVAFAEEDPTATYMASGNMVDLPDDATAIDPEPEINPLDARLTNYFEGQYSFIRRDQHHYCLGTPIEVTFSDPDLPNRIIYVESMNTTAFPDITRMVDGREENGAVWSLFFQYPVLSYIDTSRKEALLYLIASLANGGPNILNPPFAAEDICLGAFETYAVSQYDEGFLMRIYLDSGVVSDDQGVLDYINDLNENFERNIEDVANDDNDDRVQRFRGRLALYIPAFPEFDTRNNTPGSNFHPGSTLSRNEDPTLFAVFRGSWPYNLTDSDNQEGVGLASRMARSAASNPNPINYGLEAGDIVFAVIGSIFLFIMAALIVLGYFIHPFFLS